MKFTHPNYPVESYRWTLCDEDCWVPHMHVVTTVNTTLSLSSVFCCQYRISSHDIEVIENLTQDYSQLYFCVVLIDQEIYMVSKHHKNVCTLTAI